MKFSLSSEHRAFDASLRDLLSAAGTSAAIRAWACGKHELGLALWAQLSDLGVPALLVPERHGGLGADAVDLAVAFEALGYHAVPGPLVESMAVLPTVLTGELADRWLPLLASGEVIGTVAVPPYTPFLLDADIAELRLVSIGGECREVPAPVTTPMISVDRSRRLYPLPAVKSATMPNPLGTDVVLGQDAQPSPVSDPLPVGAFAAAANLLGLGQWLLDTSVDYARTRAQYGRPIGQNQAIKHLLADVVTRLEPARALLYGAAVALAQSENTARRDVSAARVACADAAYLAARSALQVHGAIGYTAEHDLGLWLTKVRALQSAWGTHSFHRRQVLEALRR